MTGATIKRDLRTGRSLWADSHGLGVPVRPLNEAISASSSASSPKVSRASALGSREWRAFCETGEPKRSPAGTT